MLALRQPGEQSVTNLTAWSHVPGKQHQHGEEEGLMFGSAISLAV